MSEQKKWKVGFIGLGKLGLPVATAMALRGTDVMGYDVNPERMSYAPQPYQETGPDGDGDFNMWLAAADPGGFTEDEIQEQFNRAGGHLRFGSVAEVVDHAEIIFIAVQTPHDPAYEGITPLSAYDEPKDFDYTYLRSAVYEVVDAYEKGKVAQPKAIAVISTVLPGTVAREIKPVLPPELPLVYNPAFIAMGTTMQDFLDPEFVLIGVDDFWAAQQLSKFYEQILPNAPQQHMSVPSAELTKVAYNTAISQKIVLANTIMEICHKIPGASCDDVTRAMKKAYRRITGPTYMDGGMGDSGGCHPRDNIAMMWLAKELKLSHSPFVPAMRGREQQARWLMSLMLKSCSGHRLAIAGYAYKPGTNLTIGSSALLIANMLRSMGWEVMLHDNHADPLVPPWLELQEPAVVLIGCAHAEFASWNSLRLAPGSVVIDPFRRLPAKEIPAGVKLVRVGIGVESDQEVASDEDEQAEHEELKFMQRRKMDHTS